MVGNETIRIELELKELDKRVAVLEERVDGMQKTLVAMHDDIHVISKELTEHALEDAKSRAQILRATVTTMIGVGLTALGWVLSWLLTNP